MDHGMATDPKRRSRAWRSRRTVTASGMAVAIAAGAVCAAAPARTAALAAAPACSAASTQVWLGLGEGGGTAGTTYYPLEFSNVGHRTCTLFGYPGVSAFRAGLKQVGAPATRNTLAHRTVTLRPGATAHALLGFRDWGAICSKPARALGLKVFAPGQTSPKEIEYAFDACAHRSVLVVGPLRRGVGIPGDTAP